MKIQRYCKQPLETLSKPVNVVKNLCKYTYNIAPRSYKTVQIGLANGAKIAKEKNLGKIGTIARKGTEVIKSVSKDLKPIELPVVLSALALPFTPVGGSVVAFAAGCVLAMPSMIKKLLTKELTFTQIREFMHNMGKKDYIKLDKGIKDTVSKFTSFTKLRK